MMCDICNLHSPRERFMVTEAGLDPYRQKDCGFLDLRGFVSWHSQPLTRRRLNLAPQRPVEHSDNPYQPPPQSRF